MKMIDEQSAKQLKEKFEKELKRNVDLVVFVKDDNCPFCQATVDLVKDLEELTGGKIKARIYKLGSEESKKYGVERAPTVLIDPDNGYRIIYTGAPLGHEGWAFIDTIIYVSQDDSKLSPESREKLKNLKEKRHIQVFITPTCPYCPMAVLLANKIAIEKKGIVAAECVEAQEHPDMAIPYNVTAVPHQVINNKTSSIGVQPEPKFVDDVIKG